MKRTQSLRNAFIALGIVACLGVAAPLAAQDRNPDYRTDVTTTDRDYDRDFDWGWLGLLGLAGLLGLRHRRVDDHTTYNRTGV